MSDIRQLGRFAFELSCENPELKDQMKSLFLPCDKAPAGAPYVVHITEADVRTIVNLALRFHDGCLWIDAAALVSPAGKRVMIAGASHSGKSTCTVALALKKKWKVVSEDITLFDLKTDKMLSFASPFSLKPGTADRLSANDCHAPDLVLNEWIPLNGMAAEGELSPNLHFAFSFVHIADPTDPGPLVLSKTGPTDFVRRLLPISNLLHNDAAVEKMCSYLADCQCFILSGGTISERLNKIDSMASV